MKSINLAPSITEMKGVTVRITAGAAVAAVMFALLCNSVFKRTWKSSAGISRSALATRTRESSSGAEVSATAPARIASIAWSSNSSSARSGMSALHLSPEVLNGPKLQLFHGALTAVQLLGDLADALLLHEAHMNHAKLRLREPVH